MSNEKTKQEEIEKLDFDDVELNFEVKNIKIEPTDVESKNENSTSSVIPKDDEVMEIPSEGVSNKTSNDNEAMETPSEGVTNNDSDNNESTRTPSEGVSNKDFNNNEAMGTSSDGVPNKSSKDDKINNFTDSQKSRGLRDKIDDAKQKNQDRKDKFNEAKDKVKNAPDNLKRKRDELKDKWNNRPKNAKELGNRAKNAGKNLGNNIKQRAKDGIKQGAQNAFNNSRTGQAINKGKDLVDKGKKTVEGAKKAGKAIKGTVKFFSTPAGWWTLAGIAIGLLIMVIIIMVPSLFASGSPGIGGEVQDEENYSKYSEVDQETIDELKKIYKKNPTGDPAYAMTATLYPYIEEMQNGNVASLRAKTNKEQEDNTDELDEDNSNNNENNNENEDEKEKEEDFIDNEDDITSDDPYLELFRKRKYRKKFKKLLKESTDGEEEFTKFLKDKWFDKDKGYKELFDGVDSKEELSDAIIDDILSQKDDFLVYFYDNCQRSYSTTPGGQITLDYTNDDGITLQELVTKNILVDVKSSSCTSTGKLTNCESIYSSPISMQKYIYGVTLQEIGDYGLKKDIAFMIAAKSYAIGRAMERGNVIKLDDNTYAIGIIDSTSDQAYCDHETFQYCSSGINSISEKTLSNFNEAWEISKNIFLLNGKKAFGPYVANVNSSAYCSYGTCMFQEEVRDNYNEDSYTYKEILQDQYRNKEELNIVTVESGFASTEYSTSSNVCKNNVIDDSNFVYYAQNDYTNTAFCHRSLTDDSKKSYCNNKGNSICTSGCGVTSMAMVVATLTQNSSITPETINSATRVDVDCDDSGSKGDSLIPNFSSTYGLTSEQISIKSSVSDIKTKIKEELDKGNLVIGNTDGSFGSGIYKTGGGHFIVIRGYFGDKVYIADPFQTSSMVEYCEEFNAKNQCVKLSTDFDNLIDNVKLHNVSGFYIIKGGTSFKDNPDEDSNDDGNNEGLNDGTQKEYFAPVQNVKPNFGSISSTPGCSNNVSHDLTGVDEGTKLYAGMDGIAEFKQTYCSDKLVSYGNRVQITGEDGISIIYAHLKDFPSDVVPKILKTCPKKGNTPPCPASSCNSTTVIIKKKNVKKGDYIGTLGNTGNSTGAHLHVEIHKNGSCVKDPWAAFGMR